MASTAELNRAIADAATNPDERRASQALVRALGERGASLGGGGLPADDSAISERILAEARVRSARITGETDPAPIPPVRVPWWLWLAWAVAIVGAVVAWTYLG